MQIFLSRRVAVPYPLGMYCLDYVYGKMLKCLWHQATAIGIQFFIMLGVHSLVLNLGGSRCVLDV